MSDMYVLRGERVLQALNEVSTYDDLYNNIQKGFPETKKRQHATNEVTISKLTYSPVRITNEGGALRLSSITRSNQHEYKQQVLLSDVSFVTDGSGVSFVATDGQTYNVQPIRLNRSRLRVNCTCLDFHYRFASWNFNDDSLLGKKPPLYQRKTDNRPPVNPARVPGLCKHLVKVFDKLYSSGMLTD